MSKSKPNEKKLSKSSRPRNIQDLNPAISNPILNLNVPTNFVDFAQASVRTDGTVLVSFALNLPDGKIIEQARIVGSIIFLKNVVSLLSTQLDYYPMKQVQKEEA
jgi:hypothetical protein